MNLHIKKSTNKNGVIKFANWDITAVKNTTVETMQLSCTYTKRAKCPQIKEFYVRNFFLLLPPLEQVREILSKYVKNLLFSLLNSSLFNSYIRIVCFNKSELASTLLAIKNLVTFAVLWLLGTFELLQ